MSKIPKKFRKYYKEFSDNDAINYTGVDNERELFEMYSAQSRDNLKLMHLGWVMAKKGYIEVLSELGMAFAEALKDKNEKVFLSYFSDGEPREIKLSLLEELFV